MRKIIGFTSAFSILGDLGQCLSLHTQALASVLQAFFSLLSHSVMSDFCNSMVYSPPGSFVHGDSPGKSIGVGFHALLQGIFPTQGSNPGLLHCRQIFYHLSHQGNSWILEWVAYPFCSGSSQRKNQTRVSCMAGGFFTSWAYQGPITNFIYI